ncbi:MAG TPA: hypothetical protein VHJ82_02255 [Actinomycetota bacterium]|nr:hypothetical protein [Actinomycetota bacterium]
MRKVVTLITAIGLLVALVAPAAAQKKKTVEEEWTATAPVPGPAAQVDPSTCGVENASYVVHPFSTPGKGILDVTMDQFQGDWDLYVKDADGNVIGSSTGFVEATVERVVIPLGAKEDIQVHSCNFVGGPTAHLLLKYTYK